MGVEQFEQKVTDVKDNEKFEFETYFPNVYSDKSSENGFNFWFHKFFKWVFSFVPNLFDL